MTMKVFGYYQGKKLRCSAIKAFKNKETKKSYLIILNPIIENDTDTVIPLLFNPFISFQKAELINDAKDKEVIEEIINQNTYMICFEPHDINEFEVRLDPDDTLEDDTSLKKIAEKLDYTSLLPKNIDDAIKAIDERLVSIICEESINEFASGENTNYVSVLIQKIIGQNILLTHISCHIINAILSSHSINIQDEDRVLLNAFEELLLVLSKKNVIKQDAINALVVLIQCENCTVQLFYNIINNKSFSEVFSRDVLQSILYNVVYRVSDSFSKKDIKTAADYFYRIKDTTKSIALYKKLYDMADNKREQVIILNSLGCCYVDNMQFEDACTAFRHATEIDTNYAIAYNNLAYTLSVESDTMISESDRQHKLQEALIYINDAIQIDSKDVSFVSNRVYIEYELGHYEHVLTDYDRARKTTKVYSDLSTIIKCAIDSRIKLYLNAPQKNSINFESIYDDLYIIYCNEKGNNKFYYEALDVYNNVKQEENMEKAKKVIFEIVLLEFYVRELMTSIAVRNPNEDIIFYTSLNNLQKILNDESDQIKHRLPIFSVDHMNDPSEGQELQKALFESIGNSLFMQDLFNSPVLSTSSNHKALKAEFTFLKSFTKSDDSLPMWVHYANAGKGCSVKVSPRFFNNFYLDHSDDEKTLITNPFDNEYRLFNVIYMQDGKLSSDASDTTIRNFEKMVEKFVSINKLYTNVSIPTRGLIKDAISKIINKLKYLFKSSDYGYEKEMRIIIRRPLSLLIRDDCDIRMTTVTDDKPIPRVFVYTNKSLGIEKITLGPRVHDSNNIVPYISIQLMKLNDYQFEKVVIEKSSIEYR